MCVCLYTVQYIIYGFGRIYDELKSIEENEFNFKEEVVCVCVD